MKFQIVLTSVFILILIFACQKEENAVLSYRLDLPDEHFDYVGDFDPFLDPFGLDNTPWDNFMTDPGATLGRVLFYDKRLSKSNLVSCASCHDQRKGFAENKKFSTGFINGDTKRNSLSFANLRGKSSFFWDERATTLEEQVLMPVVDHIEMGIESVEDLVLKLEEIDYYPSLFEDAFGNDEITHSNISKALAQFLRSINIYSSKFDLGLTQNFSNFSSSERNGFELFNSLPCGSCHNGHDFRGWGSANIGLDMVYEDGGMAEWQEGVPSGMFRIPTLRNIALTGPYMHDGRFETLKEVMQHYIFGIEPHSDLDGRLRFGSWSTSGSPFIAPANFGDPIRLTLSNSEIDDVIAFLNTLTDHESGTAIKYSDPFILE